MNIRNTVAEIYRRTLDGESTNGLEKITDSTERAFAKRLLLTVLRKQEFLRKVINRYSSRPFPPKPDFCHLLILLGATEILYFETPEYAAVNSYVELAKQNLNKYAGGFVNAVLHKICGEKASILTAQNTPFFPKSFRKILQKDYNNKQISAIEKACQNEVPLDITVKSNAEDWCQKLNGTLLPNGSIRIYAGGAVTALAGYNNGDWWVQDFSSSLAVKAMGNIGGCEVLDICAAPGGKTAQLINAGAKVTALDISAKRLEKLIQNLQRLHFEAQEIICADALDFLEQTSRKFTAILLDAPCSATGTLRRHPEIVHNRSLQDVDTCSILQKKLLDSATARVAQGGTLVYSVCSLSAQEGEHIINNFIAENPDWKIVALTPADISPQADSLLQPLFTPAGFIRCLPSHLSNYGGIDGFFIARIQKES